MLIIDGNKLLAEIEALRDDIYKNANYNNISLTDRETKQEKRAAAEWSKGYLQALTDITLYIKKQNTK